jgi:putative hydrolase of the HAD superfamily
MKIQTVIFDVGNVLAAFRWKDYLHAFDFSPAFQEELGRILFLDPLWFEWDRGVMTEDEIVEIGKAVKECVSKLRDMSETWQEIQSGIRQSEIDN